MLQLLLPLHLVVHFSREAKRIHAGRAAKQELHFGRNICHDGISWQLRAISCPRGGRANISSISYQASIERVANFLQFLL